MNKRQEYKTFLLTEMSHMKIIDAHEHVGPEVSRIAMDVDVLTMVSNYNANTLMCAGMKREDVDALWDQSIPLVQRFQIFEPFWKKIRYTSMARPVLLTINKFYHENDINLGNCEVISERMKKFNKAGIYKKVFHETCHIERVLTQVGYTEYDDKLLVSVMPGLFDLSTWDSIRNMRYFRYINWPEQAIKPRNQINTLDDMLDFLEYYILEMKQKGSVGIKMWAYPYKEPDRSKADEEFLALKYQRLESLPLVSELSSYVADKICSLASKSGLVVSVHSGYWDDFRQLNPLHILPLSMRHPDTLFDLYHLGFPWVREAMMLAKGQNNVWINLCWDYLISQRVSRQALDEAIDLLPTNKIIGFGGDHLTQTMEKVYGHLEMAKECIAEVLAERIGNGDINDADAVAICESWLYHNAKELYGLS